jgi:hypothetical protein
MSNENSEWGEHLTVKKFIEILKRYSEDMSIYIQADDGTYPVSVIESLTIIHSHLIYSEDPPMERILIRREDTSEIVLVIA